MNAGGGGFSSLVSFSRGFSSSVVFVAAVRILKFLAEKHAMKASSEHPGGDLPKSQQGKKLDCNLNSA
jgi:hypothetical protein